MKSPRLEVEKVRAAASNQWKRILVTVADIPESFLDERREGPCPWCRGETRFRMVDVEKGAVFCNQCFSEKNGDGFAAIMKARGCTFPEAARLVADFLGITAEPRKESPVARLFADSKVALIKSAEAVSEAIAQWAAIRGTTPGAIRSAGGIVVTYSGLTCIAFPSKKKGEVVGVYLRRADGKKFAAKGRLAERKTHLLRGSKDGWTQSKSPTDETTTVIRAEGIGDFLTLADRCPANSVVVTNGCGAGACPEFPDWFSGKEHIVFGQADEPGIKGQQRYAAKVSRIATAVYLIDLPYDVTPTDGKDVADFVLEGGSIDDLLQAKRKYQSTVSKSAQSENNGLIDVVITTEEHEAVSRVCSNLYRLEGNYQRGGRLVRVIEVFGSEHGIDRSGTPTVQDYPQSVLRTDLTKVFNFAKLKQTKDGPTLKSVHSSQWLIRSVAEHGVYETVRRLRGVVSFPCILSDGSILKEPGYDQKSGLLLTARVSLPEIPEEPTREQAVTAADALMAVVCDFPFVSRDHASVWLALVITLVSRFAFSGPAPLFLFDASTAGSGKSLLTDLASLIVMAVSAPKFANSTDDDEMRKRITAIAAAGDLMVVIDNISGSFGTPSLDAALTADTVKDRLLGRSEIVSYPLNWVVAGTGNNCQANGDMKRRVVVGRLQPNEENPEDRSDFKFPDVRSHVLDNRPSLLAAALTIARAYIAAGRPKLGLQPMGSYEAWGSLVRNAVVWAGWPDPALTRKQFAAMSDPQATALAELLEGWSAVDPENSGLTAAEILRSIERYPLAGEMISLALQELCSTPSGKLPSARQVGNKLKSIRGRVVNGRKLEGFINRTKTQVWRVVDATSGRLPTAGSEGMVYPQAEIDVGEIDMGEEEKEEEKWDRGESAPADPADPALRFDPNEFADQLEGF